MKTEQRVSEIMPSSTMDQTKPATNPEELEEVDTHMTSDKKTDEVMVEEKPRNLVWRLGSGLYSTATGAVGGAVGYSVGGIKWVAGKGYDATSAVVSTTATVVKKVPVPTLRRKDKKE